MIDIFKRFFSSATDNGKASSSGQDNDRDVMVAVCALFLEMGRIDETFTEQETAHVLSILRDKYGVAAEDVDLLIAEADRELHESVDLWQFARVINDRYRIDQKEKLIERLQAFQAAGPFPQTDDRRQAQGAAWQLILYLENTPFPGFMIFHAGLRPDVPDPGAGCPRKGSACSIRAIRLVAGPAIV
jgi:uncharacterized tellurite resistance protein B-like protein